MRLFFLSFLLLLKIEVKAQTDVLKDPRDGHEYKTVQIGTQTWMAENLKYAPTIVRLYSPVYYERRKHKIYVPGPKDYETDPIPNSADIFCYNDDSICCAKYGMLYTWTAAHNSCPVGWHLPSLQEFEKLLQTVGDGNMEIARETLVKGGSSNFEALYGGWLLASYTDYQNTSQYGEKRGGTSFWTSTERKGLNANAQILSVSDKDIEFGKINKANACSVRCVKDSAP